jgi:hypothetical protein
MNNAAGTVDRKVRLSLRLKLTLGFLLIAMMVGIASFVLIYNEKLLQSDFEIFISVNMEEMEYASKTAFWLQRIKSNFRELMLESIIDIEESEIERAQKTIESGLSTMKQFGEKWLETVQRDLSQGVEDEDEGEGEGEGEVVVLTEREELAEIKKLLRLIEKFSAISRKLLKMYDENPAENQKHHDYFEDKLEPLSRQLQAKVDLLWNEAIEESQSPCVRLVVR